MRCTFKTAFYVNGSKERNGMSRSLEALRLQPLGERVSNGIRFILTKILCHKDTARYVSSYSKPFGLLPKELACR